MFFRYHELLFIIDTCQAVSMFQQFYSPNLLGVGSSQVGEDSLSVRTFPLLRKMQTISAYTPVHLVESVGNCELCMRWCPAFSSYTHAMHCELVIMHELVNDACVKHEIKRSCKLPSLPLLCTGYNFLLTQQGGQEYNRSLFAEIFHWIKMQRSISLAGIGKRKGAVFHQVKFYLWERW